MCRSIPVLALTLALFLALPAFAVDLDADDVQLPAIMDVAGQSLVLNGVALRVAYGIVDVYVAGLYLPHKTTNDTEALNMPGAKYMSMTFVRDVESRDICDAWKEGFEDNLPEQEVKDLDIWLEQLCSATPDILEGDVVAYVYDPEVETTSVLYNGAPATDIPGSRFYFALLSCWIGPDPGPGRDFKEGVLGLDD